MCTQNLKKEQKREGMKGSLVSGSRERREAIPQV